MGRKKNPGSENNIDSSKKQSKAPIVTNQGQNLKNQCKLESQTPKDKKKAKLDKRAEKAVQSRKGPPPIISQQKFQRRVVKKKPKPFQIPENFCISSQFRSSNPIFARMAITRLQSLDYQETLKRIFLKTKNEQLRKIKNESQKLNIQQLIHFCRRKLIMGEQFNMKSISQWYGLPELTDKEVEKTFRKFIHLFHAKQSQDSFVQPLNIVDRESLIKWYSQFIFGENLIKSGKDSTIDDTSRISVENRIKALENYLKGGKVKQFTPFFPIELISQKCKAPEEVIENQFQSNSHLQKKLTQGFKKTSSKDKSFFDPESSKFNEVSVQEKGCEQIYEQSYSEQQQRKEAN